MTTIASRTAAAAFLSLLLLSPAYAQTTTAPAAAPAATDKKADKPPRTAASLECSKEADAKGLHGKERKKFRSDCKKAAADKGTADKAK